MDRLDGSQGAVQSPQPGVTPADDDAYDANGAYGPPEPATLKQALINEKGSPEILQYAEGLVAQTEAKLAQQEALLENWEGDAEKALPGSIIQYDIHRVRYLLRGYLRVRLAKAEEHVMALLDDAEALERLSAKERAYASQYFRLFGRQMKACLLEHLPPNFESMVKESSASERKDMVDAPDLERHVFCSVLEDCGSVAIDETGDSTVEFNQGDLWVIRYRLVRHLLADNSVELV